MSGYSFVAFRSIRKQALIIGEAQSLELPPVCRLIEHPFGDRDWAGSFVDTTGPGQFRQGKVSVCVEAK